MRELGIRETIQQARFLTATYIRDTGNRAYDSYFRRTADPDDIPRICGFKTAHDCAGHFRTRTSPVFFLNENAQPGSADFRERFPHQTAAILAAADNVLHHKFDLLGSGLVELDVVARNTEIDAYLPWHTDFKSGIGWSPRAYYRDIRYGQTRGVDVKVPWELSRFHHLVTIGQAYYLTGNTAYSDEFVKQVSDWITQNPCRYGVNWACTMDVGIRAVNWIWAFHFFRQSPSVTDDFLLIFLNSLYTHATFIHTNLEFRMAWINGAHRRLNSNHYLSDLTGLLFIAVMFPEFKLERYADFAAKELQAELFEETASDGVDYEHSTSYHRLVLELFLSSFALLELNGSPMPAAVRERLEKMSAFVADYTRPDSSAPQIGDSDNGRLHPLSIRPHNDHAYLPLAASKFLSSDSLRIGDPDPEAWWWAGSMPDTPVHPRASAGYPETRFYIMRSSNAHVFISAAEVGMCGLGSHSHNDILSFEYWATGCAWIVDPGTYVYTPDPDARNYFRSTAVHNTVRIDGAEINPVNPDQIFQLSNVARVTIRKWITTDKSDTLEGEHSGYSRLNPGVIHRRKFEFSKTSGSLSIEDHFEGAGTHEFEWFFHLAPGVSISQNGPVFNLSCGSRNLQLRFSLSNPDFEIVNGWYSPSYGIRKKSHILIARMRTAISASLCISFVPEGAQTGT